MPKTECTEAAGAAEVPCVIFCRFFPGLFLSDQLAEIASLGAEFDRTVRKRLADDQRALRASPSIADQSTPSVQPLAFNQGLQVDGDIFGDPRKITSVSHALTDLDLLTKPIQLSPLNRYWIRVGHFRGLVKYARRCSSALHAHWTETSSLVAGPFLWKEWEEELWSPRYFLLQIKGQTKAKWVAENAARSLLGDRGPIISAFGPLVAHVELAQLNDREGTRTVDVAAAISARRTNISVSAVGELLSLCEAVVIEFANLWDEAEPEDGIPRNYRTRPITKKYAAELLGMNASSNPTATLNKAGIR